MNPSVFEQRNSYKGTPPRAWLVVRFKAIDGSIEEIQLLVDTGCPHAFVVSNDALLRLSRLFASTVQSNFGQLDGGWVSIKMPELNLQHDLLGYGSDIVVGIAKRSHPDFEGLVGLRFLRRLEYGGDAGTFWVQPLPTTT